MADTAPSLKTQSSPRKTMQYLGKIAAMGFATGGLVLLLMVLAGFFHRKVPTDPAKISESDLSKTSVAEVRLIRQPRYETAVGTIKAVHEAAVASRLLARVVEVNVKAGQAVQRDDILVRLDDKDLQARHKQAEATLVGVKANLENAALEFARGKRLMSAKAISQADFDRASTAFRTAEAEVARSEQAVQESKSLLAYATIKAPLTGTVVDKKVEVGDTVTPGQTLVAIFNPGRMQMLASVRESLALKLKVGQKVPGRIESLEHECQATISEIVPEAQASSRSFTVKVVGPCPLGVYSGMFGRIYIPLEDEEIIVVPANAIQRVGQLEMVQVVEEGKVRRRNIQTGRSIGSDMEVLAGLRSGEKVALPTSSKEVRP
jgi:RND family efflux transporter MFP subunit